MELVSHLLDAWYELRNNEQSFLTEAVEQLTINQDLSSVTLKVLSDATDRLKGQSDFMNVHAMILVENKFLSLFSSKNSQDLLASDVLLLVLLCQVANRDKVRECDTSENYVLLSRCNEASKENVDEKTSKLTSEDIIILFGK